MPGASRWRSRAPDEPRGEAGKAGPAGLQTTGRGLGLVPSLLRSHLRIIINNFKVCHGL